MINSHKNNDACYHLEEFKTEFENKKCRKVMSTYGRGLGIASPSKMTKYIIKNYKSGRVIKSVKSKQNYVKLCSYSH